MIQNKPNDDIECMIGELSNLDQILKEFEDLHQHDEISLRRLMESCVEKDKVINVQQSNMNNMELIIYKLQKHCEKGIKENVEKFALTEKVVELEENIFLLKLEKDKDVKVALERQSALVKTTEDHLRNAEEKYRLEVENLKKLHETELERLRHEVSGLEEKLSLLTKQLEEQKFQFENDIQKRTADLKESYSKMSPFCGSSDRGVVGGGISGDFYRRILIAMAETRKCFSFTNVDVWQIVQKMESIQLESERKIGELTAKLQDYVNSSNSTRLDYSRTVAVNSNQCGTNNTFISAANLINPRLPFNSHQKVHNLPQGLTLIGGEYIEKPANNRLKLVGSRLPHKRRLFSVSTQDMPDQM